MSNSQAIKLRIDELRRIRQSALGKMQRAQGSIYILQSKIRENREIFERATNEIRDLGGKVRS